MDITLRSRVTLSHNSLTSCTLYEELQHSMMARFLGKEDLYLLLGGLQAQQSFTNPRRRYPYCRFFISLVASGDSMSKQSRPQCTTPLPRRPTG